LFYMNQVYILHSMKLDRFYIGFSTDLATRLEFHANAEARKFTAKADDWELFLTIECVSKAQGLCIEKHIKQMKSKVYILNLIKYPEIIDKLKLKFADC